MEDYYSVQLETKKMKIIQNNLTGNAIIEFSDNEIKTINKNKQLKLTKESLKHLGNVLVKIVVDFQNNFDEKTKALITEDTTKVEGY
jgi:hypothetical protein